MSTNDGGPFGKVSYQMAIAMFLVLALFAFFFTSTLYSECDYSVNTFNQTYAYQNHIPFDQAHDWCIKRNGTILDIGRYAIMTMPVIGTLGYVYSPELYRLSKKLRGRK